MLAAAAWGKLRNGANPFCPTGPRHSRNNVVLIYLGSEGTKIQFLWAPLRPSCSYRYMKENVLVKSANLHITVEPEATLFVDMSLLIYIIFIFIYYLKKCRCGAEGSGLVVTWQCWGYGGTR